MLPLESSALYMSHLPVLLFLLLIRADASAAMSKAEAKAAADKAAKEAASNLSNKRFQQTQAQVDEVVDIMRMNVDKVLERDQKLSQLDDRAGNDPPQGSDSIPLGNVKLLSISIDNFYCQFKINKKLFLKFG